MIRFQRSAQTKKPFPEAVAWAKGVADYINSQSDGSQLQVFTSRFGPVTTVHWIADFENLAALDGWQMHIMGDGGYWQKVADVYTVLIEGSILDTVMMSA